MKKTVLLMLMGLLLLPRWAPAETLPQGVLRLAPVPAPPLMLADMDGRITDLNQLRGQWLMVHFWASWCGPCRREMPSIQRLAGEITADVLRIILVNTAEPEESVFAFLAIVGPDLETLLDRDGQVTARWQPRGLPASFFVDPNGRVRYVALGGREWDTRPYLAFIRSLTVSGAVPADSSSDSLPSSGR